MDVVGRQGRFIKVGNGEQEAACASASSVTVGGGEEIPHLSLRGLDEGKVFIPPQSEA